MPGVNHQQVSIKKFKDDKSNKRPAHHVKFDTDKRMKLMISSAIAEDNAKGDVAPEPDDSQNVKEGAYLLSLVQVHISSATTTVPPPVSATPNTTKPPDVTLRYILKLAATSGSK